MHRMRYAWIVGLCTLTMAPLVASAAWVGPTADPPGGNIAAPINVGTTDQVKSGGLGVNSLVVFGNSLFGGSTGSNAYLNFGATTGSSGYGIRDNNGLLEFRNSSSTWQSLQSVLWNLCGGPCGGGTSPWTTSGNNIYNANTGNVGVGATNPGAKLEVKDGYIRAAAGANTPPAAGTGKGVEIVTVSANGNGYVQAYDRTANTYIPLNIVGNPVVLSGGNVGVGTASPSWRFTVVGPAADWAQVVNWPPGSVNGYGILVGTGAGKYSQFQNAEGYYTQLGNSSWGALTNGNMYASDYYIAAAGRWASQMRTTLGAQFLFTPLGLYSTCPSGSVLVGMSYDPYVSATANFICQWLN